MLYGKAGISMGLVQILPGGGICPNVWTQIIENSTANENNRERASLKALLKQTVCCVI
jgi:hypothetical protein